ncbi:hypothetical protein TYRP_022069 [Tyrophagus putrescentiae]|nr:hypothetical protein TYRP_022069 [Tyrophagus putrescentiae]
MNSSTSSSTSADGSGHQTLTLVNATIMQPTEVINHDGQLTISSDDHHHLHQHQLHHQQQHHQLQHHHHHQQLEQLVQGGQIVDADQLPPGSTIELTIQATRATTTTTTRSHNNNGDESDDSLGGVSALAALADSAAASAASVSGGGSCSTSITLPSLI